MKPKILYLLLLFIIINSCHLDPYGSSPCPAYQTQYHYLSAAAINKTPYFTNPAFDTISFSSNKGDTITFVKIKTDSSWYCIDDNGNPNCPKEKANCYQIVKNSYLTIKGHGTFSIRHSLDGPNSNYDKNRIEYFINGDLFSVYDDLIGYKDFPTYLLAFNSGNLVYSNSISIFTDPDDTLNSSKGFINSDYGLFLIYKKSENILWEIIHK